MLVLVTYDVDTTSSAGKRRLRQVAKICKSYGQRVQCSVFECDLDSAQLCVLKDKLAKTIETSTDSLRFYNLGNKYQTRIEHLGAKAGYDPEGVLLV